MTRLAGPRSALAHLPRRRAAPGGVVLGYHDVLPPGAASVGLSVSATLFAAQLRVLDRLGLRIVPLATMVDRLAAGADVDELAAVTFDDALSGVHHHGLDVLDRAGASATVFVVSDHRGDLPPWWEGMPPTMTDDELGDLVAAGHDLGSHTCSHRSLPSLTHDELVDELTRSRSHVAALSPAAVDLLAYPSGHHDPAVRTVAREAGYRAAVTFLNGRVTAGVDEFRIPRLTMGAHLSPARLAYQLLRDAASWPDHQLDRVGP